MSPTKASDHFTYHLDIKKGKRMTCKHCLTELSNAGNGTGKSNHLKAHHKHISLITSQKSQKSPCSSQENSQESHSGQQAILPDKRNTPLKAFILSKNPFLDDSSEKIKLTGLVVDFIVKNNMPLSIVDNVHFVKLCNGLDSRYRLPCRQTMTNKIIPEK